MINFVEGFVKVHYNKIGTFAVFQVIKNFLSEADKLGFIQLRLDRKPCWNGPRRLCESKWFIILETRICSISFDEIQVREIGPYLDSLDFGSFFVTRGDKCRLPAIWNDTGL